MKKRILSLIAAVLLITQVILLAACGDNTPDITTAAPNVTQAPTDESSEVTVVTEYTVEKKDYNGETFTIYMRNHDNTDYAGLYIVPEEDLKGENINSSVEARNARLEDFFNIRIASIEKPNPLSTIDKDLKDGELAYDLILAQGNLCAKKVTSNSFKPWDNLGINFENEWWDSNCLKTLSIGGYNYLMQNDVSVSRYCCARFFYWNKRMVKDYHLSNPYELMDKNQWTLDNFLTMVKGVSNIGASGIGEYGLLLEAGKSNGVYMHLLNGFNLTESSYDSNGKIVANITDKNTMLIIDDTFAKIKEVFNDTNYVLDFSAAKALDTNKEGEGTAHVYDWGRKLFSNGHFLFNHIDLECSVQFIDMEDEYGVACNPKLNADQTDYYHKNDPNTLMFVIPNHAAVDTDKIARIMDYWGYLSEDTVQSQYYEITIKTKRAYEAEAGAVIDTVKRTARGEITMLLGVGINDALENAYNNGSVSSAWDRAKTTVNKVLQNYNNFKPSVVN